jgi:hypothetical protein
MSQTAKQTSEQGTDWLQKAARQFLARFKDLSRDELHAKPPSGGWSRAQVVQHMMLAYSATVAELERRLAKGAPTKRLRTPKEQVMQFVLIRLAYFPPGRKAPQMVNPELTTVPPLDGPEMAAEYRRLVGELKAAIARAESMWGRSVAIATHPVLGPLNAPQWRKFHAVHTLHHTKQLDRVGAALKVHGKLSA